VLPPVSAATTWYVDDSGGADFSTIQDAVNASADGDTIIVRDGTYSENVLVNKSLTIQSENGSGSTTVARPSGPLADHRFAVSADYVTISGFTLKGGITDCGKAGVGLIGVAYCNITDNVAINDSYGIRLLSGSNNNSITNNLLRENYKGIELSGASNDNLILENNASSNADYGIWIESSHRNIVTHNIVSRAEGGGNIFLLGSNSNSITYNTISLANAESGGWVGIMVQSGADNRIYLNNFIDNGFNAATAYIDGNIWNSTEPVEYTYNGTTYESYLGNYWDDYAGNDTDGDGIGDTPYNIYKSTDYDYYPLMAPIAQYFGAPEVCGDVNTDGKLTLGDGRLVYLHVIYGDDEYPLANPWAADVNDDGKITMGDGRLVYLHVIYGAGEYPLECGS
jgi:parallel beta-helix repeat protein